MIEEEWFALGKKLRADWSELTGNQLDPAGRDALNYIWELAWEHVDGALGDAFYEGRMDG